ncbi:serine O-acetyltransferase [Gordonia sp. NPDC003376]
MNLRIQQGVTVGSDRVPGTEDNSPQIENGVVLGAGSRIIGPVVLGDRCVVGANAVVTSSVESGVTVVGVPARPIRSVS